MGAEVTVAKQQGEVAEAPIITSREAAVGHHGRTNMAVEIGADQWATVKDRVTTNSSNNNAVAVERNTRIRGSQRNRFSSIPRNSASVVAVAADRHNANVASWIFSIQIDRSNAIR